MYKVTMTIGEVAKPGDYVEAGYLKDEQRLFNIGAIVGLEKGEKVPEDAVVLKAEKPPKDPPKDPEKEVKKA
jgi:hypothetical protein